MRAIVVFGLLVGGTLCAQAPPRQAVEVRLDPCFARHGVQVSASTAGDFSASIEALVGRSTASEIASLHPYTLILRNTGLLEIRKVVIEYPRIGGSGEVVAGSTTFDIRSMGQRLLPGASVVLTPDAELASYVNPSARSPRPVQALAALRGRVEPLFDPNRFRAVAVSLDSVVFAGGTVLGPDHFGLVAIEARKGEAEVRLLNRLSDASLPAEDASRWLEGIERDDRFASGSRADLPDQARLYEGALAHAVLTYLKQYGKSGAAQWLSDVHSQRVPLRRLEE